MEISSQNVKKLVRCMKNLKKEQWVILAVTAEIGFQNALKIRVKIFMDNQYLLQADRLSDEWKLYTEYIDHMIVDGQFKAIKCSLQYLTENTETTFKSTPFFEVQLVFNSSETTFKSSLDLMSMAISGILWRD
ncbi:dynein heavy chain axonemal-like [Limosa lapponica baueri]|uniref:Dynein heavy chain axonemal-like n=1 Tax=Limosa lapponica baueri TaxID=1758121 RepID=A0A2I0UTM5_LIMLA|nr:dynein heavy chain axonemal-like [Limosa lapponica baueri]